MQKEVIFMSFVMACFSYFFDFAIEEGNIFGFYGRWLHNSPIRNTIFYKPLGGCIVCANIWHSLISFAMLCFIFHWHLSMVCVYVGFAYLMLSNFFVRVISKYI